MTRKDLEQGIKEYKKSLKNYQKFLDTRTPQEKKEYTIIMNSIKERRDKDLFMIRLLNNRLKKTE